MFLVVGDHPLMIGLAIGVVGAGLTDGLHGRPEDGDDFAVVQDGLGFGCAGELTDTDFAGYEFGMASRSTHFQSPLLVVLRPVLELLGNVFPPPLFVLD